jgi:glutamine synthetase
MKPQEVLDYAKAHGAKMVDLKFADLPGTWQHFSIPVQHLDDKLFEEGLNFDGSSIRGWKSIHESDMKVLPDATTAQMDPFMEVPTLSLICDVVDPDTFEPYDRDPRQIAKKAMAYMRSTGIADTAYFGPEAEFFIFDDVRYDQNAFGGFYQVDSDEATWNSGRDEGSKNLGYKARHKEGYFPALPTDTHHDMRTEICLELEKLGIHVERQHHEVATAGQGEINYKFDSLLPISDKTMWFKYVVKNVARRHGKTATFMPKPIFGDNGSGMHTHMSLWKNGEPLFAGDRYAGLSETALYFIGGILKNAPALCAITNPTTNSYKRLVPGFEAPINLAYSYRNRSAAVRIPNTGTNPKAKRIEFRTPDPSANIYLSNAALLMAGLDGIMNKIHPGDPLEKDIYGLSPQELAKVPSIPPSLEGSLEAMRANGEFLLRGDVFTRDVLNTWIDYKYEKEIRPMQQRPAPYEFYLYYDL